MSSPALDRWFKDQKKRREGITLIEDGLLRDSLGGYVFYRVKYFLLRTLLAALVFGIELRVLLEGFEEINFQKSLGLKSLVVLVSAAWWAGLEIMRSDIRRQKRDGKPYLIGRVILNWQDFSMRLGGGVLVAVLVIVAWITVRGHWSPFALYGVVALLRLVFEIPMRCYHSAIYATRRIHRPLIWILFAELVSLGVFLFLRPHIGAWSVGVSALLSIAASQGVSYYFVSKMHRFLGYDLEIAKIRKKGKTAFPLPSVKKFLMQALPMCFFRLDSLLIVVLAFNGSVRSIADYNSYLLLMVAAPLIQACQELGNLFYFDFKRLEMNSHGLLRARLERSLWSLPFVNALALALLLPLLAGGVLDLGWQLPSLAYFVLFVANAYLSLAVIRAFSANRQRILVGVGATMLVSMIVLLQDTGAALETRLYLLASLVLVHAFALARLTRWIPLHSTRSDLNLLEWVSELRTANNVTGAWVRLEGEETAYRQGQLCTELGRRFRREHVRFCRIDDQQLFLFLKRPASDFRSLLLRYTGGLAQGIEVRETPASAQNFLEFVSRRVPELRKALKAPISETAIKAFSEFSPPRSQIFDLETKGGSSKELRTSDHHEILNAALRYFHQMSEPNDKTSPHWDVTAYGPHGHIRQIFAISKRTPFKMRKEWRDWITGKNLSDAWHPTKESDHE